MLSEACLFFCFNEDEDEGSDLYSTVLEEEEEENQKHYLTL